MSVAVTVAGALRYNHLLVASAMVGYEDNVSWNASVVIQENTNAWNIVNEAVQSEISTVHNGQLPEGANSCWKPLDGDLQGYWSLSAKQDTVCGSGTRKGHPNERPAVIDLNAVSVIDASTIRTGDMVNIAVNIVGYAKNATSNGISCYLNATQITGQPSNLSSEQLVSRPSAESYFANMNDGVGQAQGNNQQQPQQQQQMQQNNQQQMNQQQPQQMQQMNQQQNNNGDDFPDYMSQ